METKFSDSKDRQHTDPPRCKKGATFTANTYIVAQVDENPIKLIGEFLITTMTTHGRLNECVN